MVVHQKSYASRTKIPPHIVEYLTSKETLQAWAGMSLRWRVKQLWLEKQFSYCCKSLILLYKKHGISYRATGYMHYNGFKVTEEERLNYAKKLKKLIDSNKPVIYADESSFNAWNRIISKTWGPKNNVINLP